MKKVLLTAAAAVAVFGAAFAVSANSDHLHSNNEAGQSFNIQDAIDEENKADAEDAVKRTMEANKLQEGERLVVDRGEEAKAEEKAPAAPAAKVLPKTSAVK